MTGLRSAAPLLGVAAVLLASCGQSGGGAAASSQAAASSAPPPAAPVAASSAPSDTPVSSAAAAPLPPAAGPAATVAPAAAREEAKPEPTPAELLRNDPAYIAKERRIEALYSNARERDPTGQVERGQANAMAERRACADRACLDAWFRRREAALKQYVEN